MGSLSGVWGHGLIYRAEQDLCPTKWRGNLGGDRSVPKSRTGVLAGEAKVHTCRINKDMS